MKQDRLVSIALCTYNGEQYLTAQLDTLLCQSYKNIEIIAVDDCSTDKTHTILKNYELKCPQIKVHQNEKNLGFSKNFEKAVSLCKGELIALCDQDDLWHPKKIELQVNAIRNNILIYHDSEFINEDGTSMNKKMSDIMNLYRGSNPEVFLFSNCVSGHSMLIKKNLLHEALPLPANYFHDWWLAYVATNIGSIDFIPECLVRYRQHEQSETNILKLARNKNNYESSDDQSARWILNWLSTCSRFKNNKNKKVIEAIYNEYINHLINKHSWKYSFLLFKYWKYIFYTRKKSILSKLNLIRKQSRGLGKINFKLL